MGDGFLLLNIFTSILPVSNISTVVSFMSFALRLYIVCLCSNYLMDIMLMPVLT